MLLWLYRTFSILCAPLIDIWLLSRRLRGKEDAKRYAERQGKPALERPNGFLLWLHAASVGEAISVLPLINGLVSRYPQVQVMVTTGTVTSAKLLASRLPERAFHLYVPVDKYFAVKRFLKYMRPDIGLFVESELWPNLLTLSHASGVKLVQVNARMSERSFRTWQRYPSLAKAMLSCFTLTLAQSEEDASRLKALGAWNTHMLGNLKYDAPNLPVEPEAIGALIRQIAGRTLLVAASTHPGEELLLAQAAAKIRVVFPDLLVIIIPRHPSRGAEVARLTGKHIAQRAKKAGIQADTQFYIADTIGELGLFYRVAGIVFMGGSLVAHGGQNPLEAARLECALLTGLHTENFTAIYTELLEQGACIRVENADELAEKATMLLRDQEQAAKMAHIGLQLMEARRGVLNAYLDMLAPFMAGTHAGA